MSNLEAVIGLEVHAQLSTESKIFSGSGTTAGESPNTLVDPVTLGLPGSLPVLNKRVVEFAIKLGLATECEIKPTSIFARKHYFYPDLPKGYQISQFEQPICEGGRVPVVLDSKTRYVGLTRIHLEEDAGKNIHLENEPASIVDLNRTGVPLVEIVSEPEIRSGEEAAAYMRHLHQILRYLDICDGNMEEGSLRCDANISVREVGSDKLGTKVEIKNLNSFRFVEKAIEFEIARQKTLVEQGERIVQETRLWDEAKNATRSMRSKEEAQDYRYFPDPDLLPLVIDEDWVARVQDSLPELPMQAYERFKTTYELEDYLCARLTEEKLTAQYFDQAIAFHNNPLAVANWITTELFGRLNRENVALEQCPVSPENLAGLVKAIDDKTISGKIAKTVFEEMFQTSNSPDAIIKSRGLTQISDKGEVQKIVEGIIEAHPEQVEEFRQGKEKVFGFFVGQVMKASKGKANPQLVNELLQELLGVK